MPTPDESQVKVNTSRLRPIWLLLWNLVRRPRLRRRLAEYLPNVYFGYSDHPLDIGGTAINSIFSFFEKTSRSKASCVLGVTLRERSAAGFTFDAPGYNVFAIRDLEQGYAHEYRVDDSTSYEPLTTT